MSVIYLDLGCSDGHSVRSTLTGGLPTFNVAHTATEIHAFDPIRYSDWDTFNSNDYHSHPAFHFYECAVGTSTGHSFISLNEDPKVRTLVDKNENFEEIGAERMLVKQIDFPQWLQRNLKFEDTIICKMDIEGMEYELLESLIQTRDKHRHPLIGWFNHLFVEFHAFCMKEEFKTIFNEREAWIRNNCPIEIRG